MTAFPGQAVASVGPSGAGKSTLLRALAKGPPEGSQLRWEAEVLPRRPVLCLQDPEAQLLCSSVEEEVEIGPRNQGLAEEACRQRVEEALEALDAHALRRREIQPLSMGQKQRVALGAVFLLWIALYATARLGWRALVQDVSLVILQAPLVLLVFLWRQGVAGLEPALVISARFALAILPGLWVQRTTRIFDVSRILNRMLPPRLAFVLAMSLRFLPIMARDAREIYVLQRLRGARIGARDLLSPLHWPEACQCLAVPLLMRMLHLADQIAVAAKQRGLDNEHAAFPFEKDRGRSSTPK